MPYGAEEGSTCIGVQFVFSSAPCQAAVKARRMFKIQHKEDLKDDYDFFSEHAETEIMRAAADQFVQLPEEQNHDRFQQAMPNKSASSPEPSNEFSKPLCR